MLDGQDKDKFELHRIERDSQGVEKAFKVEKDSVSTKSKISAMASDVVDQILDQTFDERVKWVTT